MYCVGEKGFRIQGVGDRLFNDCNCIIDQTSSPDEFCDARSKLGFRIEALQTQPLTLRLKRNNGNSHPGLAQKISRNLSVICLSDWGTPYVSSVGLKACRA